MDMKQDLISVANRYRAQGYQVVVNPEPKDLPDFAKTFKVEIAARRADGSALVAAKKNLKELEADPNVAKYADITAKQPGWRFDVVVMAADDKTNMAESRDAREPSEDDFRLQIENAKKLLDANVNQQALALAWSVLEAAMRRWLQSEGEEAGWGTSPRTMLNELLSSGAFSTSVFRDLEGLLQARNAIVHGFAMPIVEPSAVHFLLDTARKLLEESKMAKQTA